MRDSRDRMTRSSDVAEIFHRRRAEERAGIISILDEEAGMGGATGLRSAQDGAAVPVRGISRTTGRGRGRGRDLYPAAGQENNPLGTVRRGRGRTLRSILPSWYPRVPLGDKTAITRTIERRRRALLKEIEEGQIGDQLHPDPETERELTYGDQLLPEASVPASGAQLELGTLFRQLKIIRPNNYIG